MTHKIQNIPYAYIFYDSGKAVDGKAIVYVKTDLRSEFTFKDLVMQSTGPNTTIKFLSVVESRKVENEPIPYRVIGSEPPIGSYKLGFKSLSIMDAVQNRADSTIVIELNDSSVVDFEYSVFIQGMKKVYYV